MNDERAFDTKYIQRLGDRAEQLGVCNAQQLHPRTRGVQARPEQVHDRANPECPTDGPGMSDTWVIGGREQEAEAGLIQNVARFER